MTYGVRLVRLTVTGPDRPDVAVDFTLGLNVITGPSDTGKTYIFQAIDFVPGASTPPKAIPEAQGYDLAQSTVAAFDGDEYVLERSLRGGDIRLTGADGSTRTLKPKHAADDPDTVSSFLLNLTGLSGRRVRKNQSGAIPTVSFRDLAQLVLVNEVDVMAARSPAPSGQVTTKTVESRIFRLLLTGEDDSSVIAAEVQPRQGLLHAAGRRHDRLVGR